MQAHLCPMWLFRIVRGSHLAAVLCVLALGGCESVQSKTTQGAAVGSAVGAATGAVVGHRYGETGAGMAVGAGLGGVAGSLAGSALETQQKSQTQPPPTTAPLTKFCPVGGELYPAIFRYCPIHGAELRVKESESDSHQK